MVWLPGKQQFSDNIAQQNFIMPVLKGVCLCSLYFVKALKLYLAENTTDNKHKLELPLEPSSEYVHIFGAYEFTPMYRSYRAAL